MKEIADAQLPGETWFIKLEETQDQYDRGKKERKNVDATRNCC